MSGHPVPFLLKWDGYFHLSGVVLKEQNPITVSVRYWWYKLSSYLCRGFGSVDRKVVTFCSLASFPLISPYAKKRSIWMTFWTGKQWYCLVFCLSPFFFFKLSFCLWFIACAHSNFSKHLCKTMYVTGWRKEVEIIECWTILRNVLT